MPHAPFPNFVWHATMRVIFQQFTDDIDFIPAQIPGAYLSFKPVAGFRDSAATAANQNYFVSWFDAAASRISWRGATF